MTWWQALILGIVEGLTEYLPVSSTGHLILAAWMLGLGDTPQEKAAVDSFNIIIQAGAIAAVAGLYRSRMRQMTLGLLGRDREGQRLALNLLIAFAPAAVLGLVLNEPINDYLFRPWPVIGALFVGAWLMLLVAAARTIHKREHSGRPIESVTPMIALLIGFGQCVAMWPGMSRSMMTIVAALLLGLKSKAAAEFSFLLGLVTLTAATGYAAMKDGRTMIEQLGWMPLVVGFVASTVSAALAVKWFVAFLTKHGLAPFGWYRLALAALLAALILTGVMESF